jgi:predicted glycoside hydrolase/deacetylase ChbG (UPF0249 family)
VELAAAGIITAAVLLANSPYAAAAVRAWRTAAPAADLGWHPCLTLDEPAAPPGEVSSLIGADGRMHPLGRFLTRLHLGRIRAEHIRRELEAQYHRFLDLTGHAPVVVNSHQHVALFGPVGAILRDVLSRQTPRPFLRRVREPLTTLARIPGARFKRAALTLLGRRQARRQVRAGFPGADGLIGITDPPWVREPSFFTRWVARVPGRVVELMCHPGYHDESLVGRDCRPADGYLQRRVDELALLRRADFLDACRAAGFVLTLPSALRRSTRGARHVA